MESTQGFLQFSDKRTVGFIWGFIPPWGLGSFQFRAPRRNVGFGLPIPSSQSSESRTDASLRGREVPGEGLPFASAAAQAGTWDNPTVWPRPCWRLPGCWVHTRPRRDLHRGPSLGAEPVSDNAQCCWVGHRRSIEPAPRVQRQEL